MKKNKLLLMIIIALLILTPCYVNANTTPNENNTETTTEGENTSKEETPDSEESNTTEGENNNVTKPSEEENNKTEEETSKPIEEKTIELNKSSLDLGIEQEATLIATATPSDAIIEWSSDNEEVATVDQNGKITTKKSAGTAKITATIKGTKISKTCTVVVTRTLGTDATLKSLTIKNGTLDKTFKSDVFKYSVTVDSTVTSLNFGNLMNDCDDANISCQITGNNKLKDGKKVEIIVTSEDKKNTATYEFNIVKDTVNLNLKSLKINGYALNETFNKDKIEYTASIPYEIETISIQAAAEDSDAVVTTSNLTNFKVGENVVTVTVKDQSGNNKTYKIVVTREKEVSVEENPTSIITSSSITNENNSSKNSVTPNVNNNNGGGDDFLKYAIVSLACLILFVIGGIGIYFYLKTSPKKLRKELAAIKKEEPVSPMVEVEPENINQNQVNIEELMQEDLVQTKEFKREELDSISKTENLFDDSEDV